MALASASLTVRAGRDLGAGIGDTMIPSAALLQHVAILGKTGSGKTYTAKGLVEGVIDDKRRLAVVDPTGAWWGLRSSADGKAPGYPVIVLGGHHADAPLDNRIGVHRSVKRRKRKKGKR